MAFEDQPLTHGAPPPPPAPAPPAPAPQVPTRAGLSVVPAAGKDGQGRKPAMTWGRRVEKLILTLFCLEVGAFLLVFPWMPYWNDNYFFALVEGWKPMFLSPYFRGAVSGLGALNLYLAIAESVALVGSFLEEPPQQPDQAPGDCK